MSLMNSLNIALSGLNFTQSSLDIVARNVANADTPGYTAKTIRPIVKISGTDVTGVEIGDITRQVNEFILQQFRTELSTGVGANVMADFLTRIDNMFGVPGEPGALDVVFNDFGLALQTLATSSDQVGARQSAMDAAQSLANHLNSLSGDIQNMRREAEASLAENVAQANNAMQEIARLNQEIQNLFGRDTSLNDLYDQRDQFINQLSELMDVRTAGGERGTLKVFTTTGNLLVDNQASILSFDERSGFDATALYSTTDADRGVGTVTLTTLAGARIDLFKYDAIQSGAIAALKDVRDGALANVQAQLDELAHGLATALSNIDVTGTAVSAGPQQGFDLDVAGLLAGNVISVSVTDPSPGSAQTYSFIRVDDASVLPLGNDATPDPNDIVIGIDFSGGLAGAVAAINAALGANITASSPAANTIRILDDGSGTNSVNALSGVVTATATTDSGVVLPLFIDLAGTFQPYSGSFDGDGQKAGFASRITVNPDVIANADLLVAYATSPATGMGDPARPLELISRFSELEFAFSPVANIGTTARPFTGTISAFAQRIINASGRLAVNAERMLEAQSVVVDTLQARMDKESKVNVDEEMGKLLALQNAYAANARVMTVVQELISLLVNM